MVDEIQKFIIKHKSNLITAAEQYLLEEVSSNHAAEVAWEIIEDWNELEASSHSLPYVNSERAFWAVVWSLIDVVSKDHWENGISQKELPSLIKALKNEEELPEGIKARRPTGEA